MAPQCSKKIQKGSGALTTQRDFSSRVAAESVLTRTGGPDSGWTVNGLAASRSGVEELIATFGEPVRPEFVANSSASFARLGVDSTASRWVRVLGRGGAVYAWSGRLGQLVRRGPDHWRDRVIARVTADSVRRIEVRRGARRYVLRHQDGRWLLGGATADSSAAARRARLIQSNVMVAILG